MYRRRAEALVEAYGDDAYADFVCNTYPALFEPLASIITASEVKAADALDELFGAWGDALAAAEDPMVTDRRRAFVCDDSVGRILDALVAVAHRAAEADVDTWRALGSWLERRVDRLRLDLAVARTCPRTRRKLAAAHASSAGDFAALAACDCPRARGRAAGLRRARAPSGRRGAVGGAARRRGAGGGAGKAAGFSGLVFGGGFRSRLVVLLRC